MLEGLWVVRFIAPGGSEGDLNGGVIVIETSRVLGGDSGYYYTGNIGIAKNEEYPLNLHIHRHDINIESVFGDADDFDLSGIMKSQGLDELGRHVFAASLTENMGGSRLNVRLTRVAELP